ncbi:MAG: hypothetical protein E7620_08275 [Ruminococcaceae bacterium]|nr:hypothetical protein [Oscillospiraceae bacterium]
MKKELFRKTNSKWVTVKELIGGSLCLTAAALLTAGFLAVNLKTSWEMGIFAILVSLVFIALLWMVGFWGIQGYLAWRRAPRILAEQDGEYLYLCGMGDEKLSLQELAEAQILYAGRKPIFGSRRDGYGDVIIRTGSKNYRLRYVHRGYEAPERIRAILLE